MLRKTKIVATMGPACREVGVLKEMLAGGMNVARFNFSHGDHAYQKRMMDAFRRAREESGLPAALLMDTKGPEIRIGGFENGYTDLLPGQNFSFFAKERIGDGEGVSLSYPPLCGEIQAGNRLLLDDGKIVMRATHVTEDTIRCEVEKGGRLYAGKSINVPGVMLAMPYISEKDSADLRFAIREGVHYVAASFVGSGEDVRALRRFLDDNGGENIRIISKIENEEGVKNFPHILALSDGIMIARGDMGVEIDFARLPGLQKSMIRKAAAVGKPVITATQMLESMVHEATPTRAEISDVANAVFDGTGAVMLSAETAAGENPALAVRTMARLALQAEKDASENRLYRTPEQEAEKLGTAHAICEAAAVTATHVGAKAIIAVTESGDTALGVSRFRPDIPILAATPSEETYQRLSLYRGVVPLRARAQRDTDHLFAHAMQCAKTTGLVNAGDLAVITAGVPLHIAGKTNILKIERVP